MQGENLQTFLLKVDLFAIDTSSDAIDLLRQGTSLSERALIDS